MIIQLFAINYHLLSLFRSSKNDFFQFSSMCTHATYSMSWSYQSFPNNPWPLLVRWIPGTFYLVLKNLTLLWLKRLRCCTNLFSKQHKSKVRSEFATYHQLANYNALLENYMAYCRQNLKIWGTYSHAGTDNKNKT